MNERAVTAFLNKHITQERVNALAQMTNTSLPGAGLVVSILGALVVRAISAAKEYIDKVDQTPIVPPDFLHHITYREAVNFFEEKKLDGMFKELLTPAVDESNPEINRDRVIVARAASVVKKCFEDNDRLFKVFYHNQIVHGEYLAVWKTYGEFLMFKAALRNLLPPAKFENMFKSVFTAVAKEGVEMVKKSDAYKRVKELVEEHINKIVPGNIVSIDKIIDHLGPIA
ncbi:MAG: hypothetical protein IH859_10035 [Chloroflexi bacterium]|nr:hypothetical protein [Chloroflexota bacterium]